MWRDVRQGINAIHIWSSVICEKRKKNDRRKYKLHYQLKKLLLIDGYSVLHDSVEDNSAALLSGLTKHVDSFLQKIDGEITGIVMDHTDYSNFL